MRAVATRRRLIVCAALLAMLPDIDVLGFGLGIAYGAPLGHRGFTHSLVFAAGIALLVVAVGFREESLRSAKGWSLVLVLALATASDSILQERMSGHSARAGTATSTADSTLVWAENWVLGLDGSGRPGPCELG